MAQVLEDSDKSKTGIFSVNFNQDCTSVSIGTKTGYQLFQITSDDKVEQICDNENADTCIAERLFSSSLVAVVSITAPRKLKVCHFKKKSEICNYSYPNSILSVKLNRTRLVVCLEESLFIHNIRDMKVLHTIRETPPNPTGLCALSTCNENCFIAYPGSNTVGQIQIFDAHLLQAKAMIPAHENPMAALAFNDPGSKIATASEKGTVIRVFSIDGHKLYEFRRGMKRCAEIYSLSFSNDSNYLLSSSNTRTVHIFKLEDPKEVVAPSRDDQGLLGWVTSMATASASYLPTNVTDIMNQERSFAYLTLGFEGVRSTVAMATIQKKTRVMVASTDGFLYIYNFNENDGGECPLVKQHKLFKSGDGPDGVETVPVALPTNYPGAARKADSKEEKMNEISAACENPPFDALDLNDENEYPPM